METTEAEPKSLRQVKSPKGTSKKANSVGLKLWDILRNRLQKGFFQSLFNQKPQVTCEFVVIVDKLWTEVHQNSIKKVKRTDKDSTVDFVLTGWAKVKADEHESIHGSLKHAAAIKGGEHDMLTSSSNLNKNSSMGIEGLSLDNVPNVDVSKILKQIAENFQVVSIQIDFYSILVRYNRGWKLLLLGLSQAEPFARYSAMNSMLVVVPIINQTLLDSSTREGLFKVLMNITVSDERIENRLRAVYVLGQLAAFLGSTREHDILLKNGFLALVKKLLEIQQAEKRRRVDFTTNRRLKISLIYAIGKYVKALSQRLPEIEEVVIYIIHEEFMKGDVYDIKSGLAEKDGSTFVTKALFDFLNDYLILTDSNLKYVGNLFRKQAQSYMRAGDILQRVCVQFIGKWLPVVAEDAYVVGVEKLISGLKYYKSLGVYNFNVEVYQQEMDLFLKLLESYKKKLSLRNRLLRYILHVPGSWTKLLPVNGHPGFFVDLDSTLMNTEGIVSNLPIHPRSSVTIARLLPKIPGVPNGVTTCPPLFVDHELWDKVKVKIPRSRYEEKEFTGKVPGLPVGCTYSPTQLVELETISSTNNSQNKLNEETLGVKSQSQVENLEGGYNDKIGNEKPPPGTTFSVVQSEKDTKKIPAGFLSMSPFSGYDHASTDKSAILNSISAIYNTKVGAKVKPGSLMTATSREENGIPDGFVSDRNPVLWPSRLILKNEPILEDFPLNSLIVFDIVQPQLSQLRRVLTFVVSTGKDIPIVGTDKQEVNDDGAGSMAIGTSFTIFVKPRVTSDNNPVWRAVNLEVLDNDYEDDSLIARKQRANIHNMGGQSRSHLYGSDLNPNHVGMNPVPAGFNSSGDPFFAPPFNFPPLPVGYTKDFVAYYGATPKIKPMPVNVSIRGTRFYNVDENAPADGPGRNQVAGYDHNGLPFFIPKGFSVPQPSGFSVDGIPYYDIPSIMLHKGIMIGPNIFEDSISSFKEGEKPQHTRLTNGMVKFEVDSPVQKLVQKMDKHPLFKFGVSDDMAALEDEQLASLEYWQEPKDLAEFFRENDDLTSFKRSPVKVIMEPSTLEFQSVHAPSRKTVLLKYKSSRGDRAERSFFVVPDPADMFSVTTFNIELQGEGTFEIPLTFNPAAMKTEKAEGSLSLIDQFGQKLCVCHLSGIRKAFIKISPPVIDAGWILPDREKECVLNIENTTANIISLNLCLQNAVVLEPAIPKYGNKATFCLSASEVSLQPLESKIVTVRFLPRILGVHSNVIEIKSPGGDVVRVPISGTAGIPIAVHPEDAESSGQGAAYLTRERCAFMKKFNKEDISAKSSHTPLSISETAILQGMLNAPTDQSKVGLETLDFHIFPDSLDEKKLCLTLINLSNFPLTIGLFPHSPLIKCEYLIRVAPGCANSVEVTLERGKKDHVKGAFNTCIEVICPEFENIIVNVKSFFGQPLYFTSWDFMFFKPCQIGMNEQLDLLLFNESQYDVVFYLDGISDLVSNPNGEELPPVFLATASTTPKTPSKILAYSNMAITLVYQPNARGPTMKKLSINTLQPFTKSIPACIHNKILHLIGVCIHPYIRRAEDIADKNGIDFFKSWLSHPSRLIKEFPSHEDQLRLFDNRFSLSDKPKIIDPQIKFEGDNRIIFKNISKDSQQDSRGTIAQTIRIKNAVNNLSLQLTLFGSTSFSIDPRSKKILDSESVEAIYSPPTNLPEYSNVYGFVMALQESDNGFHALQTISKNFEEFMFYPKCDKEDKIYIDFGQVENYSQSTDIRVRNVCLINLHDTDYSWTARILPGKSNFSAFEVGVLKGELGPAETYMMPIRLTSKNSGVFESIIEVSIKESNNRQAKFRKAASIITKCQLINTSCLGFPEFIDFGTGVVGRKKKISFHISNTGTSDSEVTILVKPPFSVEPKNMFLKHKEQKPVSIYFNPTESKTSEAKMHIFSKHLLYLVPITGFGGTCELLCEKYNGKTIEFGDLKEGTLAYMSVYLTNKGTLPLCLKAVSASLPQLVNLEYMEVTNTIPYETSKTLSREAINVKKDHWAWLKRKIQVLAVVGMLKRHRDAKDNKAVIEKSSKLETPGIPIKILKSTALRGGIDKFNLDGVPHLKPFHSFRLKLIYTSKYQSKTDTDLQFHYTPITTDDKYPTDAIVFQKMELKVAGTVFRPLEMIPPSYDFGIVTAENNFPARTGVNLSGSQVSNKSNVMCAHLVNMSLEAQNLNLKSIDPEFRITGNSWLLQPGEKIDIPISFHPIREQIQYHGVAKFVHKYGVFEIKMSGTGASAELVCEDELSFGSVKLGTSSSQIFKISNRGLLSCKFNMEILQQETNFSFVDTQCEKEGYVEPGDSLSVEIICSLKSEFSTPSSLRILWQRCLGGKWEEKTVPFNVEIGVPGFKLQNGEIDFETAFIKVRKEMQIIVANEGNAPCSWRAESEMGDILWVEPEFGVLQSNSIETLNIVYRPKVYDAIASSIMFITDAGRKQLMCYGIVGLPYLQIPEGMLDVDFGIVAIMKSHEKTLDFVNSGKKTLNFNIIIRNMQQDGIDADPTEFDVFSCSPTSGELQPGEKTVIHMTCSPKDYNSVCTAEFDIFTKNGEEYIGKLTATGGKAIVKVSLPSKPDEGGEVDSGESAEVSSRTNEVDNSLPNVVDKSKLAYNEHIENLQELLAGLRAAELDIVEEETISADGKKQFVIKVVPGANKKENIVEIHDGSDISSKIKHSNRGLLNADDNNTGSPRPSTSGRKYTPRTKLSQDPDRVASATSLTDQLATLEQELTVSFNRQSPSNTGLELKLNRLTSQLAQIKELENSKNAGEVMTPEQLESIDKKSTIQQEIERLKESTKTGTLQERTLKNLKKRAKILKELEKKLLSGQELSAEQKDALKSKDEILKKISEIELAIANNPEGFLIPKTPDSGTSSTSRPSSDYIDKTTGLGKYNPGLSISRLNTASRLYTASTLLSPLRPLTNPSEEIGNRQIEAPVNTFTKDLEHAVKQIEESETSSQQKKQMLDELNEKIFEQTKNIIKAVREKLSVSDLDNREMLTNTIRKLQVTNHVIEEVGRSKRSKELTSSNSFFLGSFKGGAKSPSIKLFDLPNSGNLSFNFAIVVTPDSLILPPSFESENIATSELFKIHPMTGTVLPGETVNFTATFQGVDTGSYEQSFSLISAGEEVMIFTLSSKVGLPKLEINSQMIDFGIVRKGQTATKTLTILNSGTFGDKWNLCKNSESNSKKPVPAPLVGTAKPIVFNVNEGYVDRLSSCDVSVILTPGNDDFYEKQFNLVHEFGTISFVVKAEIGSPKVKPIFLDQGDKLGSYLNFEACLVGNTYEKSFQLVNNGNAVAVFEMNSPGPNFILDIRKNKQGNVVISPSQTIDAKLIYNPTKKETLNDGIPIHIPDCPIQMIPIRGQANVCNWSIEGDLEFGNIPVNYKSERLIKISNVGDQDIVFNVNIEAEGMITALDFDMANNLEEDIPLPGGAEYIIKAVAKSNVDESLLGQMVITAIIGNNTKVIRIPFKFHIYEAEVALDYNDDISIGRINIGEKFPVSRKIINFGSQQVLFRTRIEEVDEDNKPIISEKPFWKIKGPASGVVAPNGEIEFTSVYEAIAGADVEAWNEALLIVEESKDGEHWSQLSNIRLKGGAGHALLEIVPSSLDFSHLPLSKSKVINVRFISKGTAPAKYELKPNWSFNDIFTVQEDLTFADRIQPGEEIQFSVTFKPQEEREYLSHFSVTTPSGVVEVGLQGIGAQYVIDKMTLPASIDLGEVVLGSLKTYEFQIKNACVYPIICDTDIFLNSPDSESSLILDTRFALASKNCSLDANVDLVSTGTAVIKIKYLFELPYTEDGGLDSKSIEEIINKGDETTYLCIYIRNGTPHVIPIKFKNTLYPVSPLLGTMEEEGVVLGDVCYKIDFGEKPMFKGDTFTFYMINKNLFSIPYTISSSVDQITTDPNVLTIKPNQQIPILVKLNPLEEPDDDSTGNIPISLDFTGYLTLVPTISLFKTKTIAVEGKLVDIPQPLQVEDIDFGPVMKMEDKCMDLVFRNPVRREIAWKVSVQSDMNDIFVIDESYRSGTASAKHLVSIPILFKPLIGVNYSAQATLVTDEGTTTFQIKGEGTEPKLNVSDEKVEFGVVGIENPEYKSVYVDNPTKVKMMVAVTSSDSQFTPDKTIIEVEPFEKAEVRLIFSPKHSGKMSISEINFTHISRPSSSSAVLKQQSPLSRTQTPKSKPMSRTQTPKKPNTPGNVQEEDLEEFYKQQAKEEDYGPDRPVEAVEGKEAVDGGESVVGKEAGGGEEAVVQPPQEVLNTIKVSGMGGQTDFDFDFADCELIQVDSDDEGDGEDDLEGENLDGSVDGDLNDDEGGKKEVLLDDNVEESRGGRILSAKEFFGKQKSMDGFADAGATSHDKKKKKKKRVDHTPTVDLFSETIDEEEEEPITKHSQQQFLEESSSTRPQTSNSSKSRPGSPGKVQASKAIKPTIIRIPFKKIPKNNMARKSFDIDNKGDTVLDLEVVKPNGEIFNADDDENVYENVSYRVEPRSLTVMPKSKLKISIVLKGLQTGLTHFNLLLRTKTLLVPKLINLIISVTVIPGGTLPDSVRIFSRADDSIERKLDANQGYKESIDDRYMIWKLLLPVIRIGFGKPSDELQSIPFVQPRTNLPLIYDKLIRPPALPKPMPAPVRKWYMTRATMMLDNSVRGIERENGVLDRITKELVLEKPKQRR